MVKCTGICSSCGKCRRAELMDEVNNRKAGMFVYPADFAADEGRQGLGVAFDIGTTTVVGMLWDLEKGRMLQSRAVTNPQKEFGTDVISRITYCGKDSEKLKALKLSIIECLNDLIKKLCKKARKKPDEVCMVTICGNTTMSHFAAGFSPKSLAVAPFSPAYTGMLRMKAIMMGLELKPMTDVIILPNIAGHVGGDITSGALACRLLHQEGLTAYIDIGTNGEMILTDGEKSYACSTAAGPAFEGASIEYGMRAADGAIERVWIEGGEVYFRTIGETIPKGICGSGLIDAIAQMLDAGLINGKGRLISAEDAEAQGMPEELTDRLFEYDGKREFVLVESDEDDDIVITQNDIREVQLAKGAVAAGLALVLEKMGKTSADLDQVIIAGAFGSYIDKENAVRIGLLPQVDPEKIIFVGNAAGTGVSMALASMKELEEAEETAKKINHLELALEENFQKVYMKSMGF